MEFSIFDTMKTFAFLNFKDNLYVEAKIMGKKL